MIPLDFMLSSSSTSLSDFQLARLNESRNLKSEARDLLEQAFDKEVEARVACWFRMNRERLFREFSSTTVPNEAEVKLWLREHGPELLRLCAENVMDAPPSSGVVGLPLAKRP